jgi:hypothetical protein
VAEAADVLATAGMLLLAVLVAGSQIVWVTWYLRRRRDRRAARRRRRPG